MSLSFFVYCCARIYPTTRMQSLFLITYPSYINHQGAWRVLNLKRYRARFSYLSPPPSYNDDNNNVQKVEVNQDNLTSLWEPVPSSWKTMEEDFILFWACQQTHAASNTHQSPGSKLDDGIFRILIIRCVCVCLLKRVIA